MAVLFLLLAVIGASVVADLVMENTAGGAITVLNHPISGYSNGLLLAMTAGLGFVVGLLAVGSVSFTADATCPPQAAAGGRTRAERAAARARA